MAYKPRIKLILTTKDTISTSEIKAPNVTSTMVDAAYDLIYTLMTNKRRTSNRATKAAVKEAKKVLSKKRPRANTSRTSG
jgi:hypothetical protein